MAVPTTLTWSLASGDGGPSRPSVTQMGEAALENDAKNPPIAPTMPTAEMLNQWQLQLAAMGGVVPALVISIRFSAGTPSVYKFSACNSDLVTGDFTIVDNGAGDTTISWPADKLPPPVAEPAINVNGSTLIIPNVEYASSVSVRVRTWNIGGIATDSAFTVRVY